MSPPRTLAATLALLAYATLVSGTASTEGCYLSRSYQAGERDILSIKQVQANTYSILFRLVYCNYTMSSDCSNARFEELEFKAELRRSVLVYHGPENCHISINLAQPGRALVSQHTACKQFQFWGPHGIYTRVESQANKACREH